MDGGRAPAFPRFPITRGLNGAAVAARQHVVVQDVAADPRYLTTFGSTRSEAVFVVKSPTDGRIIGTIDVASDRQNAFMPDDEAFLRDCGSPRVLVAVMRGLTRTPLIRLRLATR